MTTRIHAESAPWSAETPSRASDASPSSCLGEEVPEEQPDDQIEPVVRVRAEDEREDRHRAPRTSPVGFSSAQTKPLERAVVARLEVGADERPHQAPNSGPARTESSSGVSLGAGRARCRGPRRIVVCGARGRVRRGCPHGVVRGQCSVVTPRVGGRRTPRDVRRHPTRKRTGRRSGAEATACSSGVMVIRSAAARGRHVLRAGERRLLVDPPRMAGT